MRENNIKDKKSDNAIIKSNKISIIGFIVAIILLTVAVSLAINQEKSERETKLAERMNSNTSISTSKKMGKNINEVRNELELEAKKENTISDSNAVDSKNTSTVSNANNINENNTNTVNGNNTNNANVNNTNKNKIILTNAPETSTKDSTNSSSKNKENNNTNENKKTNSTENKVEFIRPMEGETSKIFSMDSLIYSETLQEWVTHRGIDIKAEKGAEVKAIANGTITSIKTDPRYGISVIIKHNNGFESIYACLLNVAQGLKEGDTIEQGQVIGNIGNSGIFESAEGMHLHFEMTKDGDYVNPDIYVK